MILECGRRIADVDVAYAQLTLSNPLERDLPPIEVRALAGSEVRFDGRACFTGALVLGEEVLLGAIAMEDMDLVISPADRSVAVNPKSPNIPNGIAK